MLSWEQILDLAANGTHILIKICGDYAAISPQDVR